MIHDYNPADLCGLLESSNVWVPRDVVRTWTATQCKEARAWAMARFSARSVMFAGTLKVIPGFLLEYHKYPDHGLCAACGYPNEPAGNCSRVECCNHPDYFAVRYQGRSRPGEWEISPGFRTLAEARRWVGRSNRYEINRRAGGTVECVEKLGV